MKKNTLYKLTGLFMATVAVWAMASATYNAVPDDFSVPEMIDQDTDSMSSSQSVDLKFPIKDNSGNPLLQNEEGGIIDLESPTNIEYRTEYDPKTQQITVYRKIGGIDVRLPYTMSLDQYLDVDTRNSMLNYWQERQQMESGQFSGSSMFGKSFRFGGEAFNSLFGSNLIDVKLQGTAELKIGFSTTNVENPTLQERLRKTTTFDFEENIQMNINGNIGDKMHVGINYNTQSLFDFENQIKLEYKGEEDEILQKVEAGNVSLPLPGTLITGSQSLFGIKTEMKFGKLTVTSIFSQQKGESKVINVEGGASKQEFDVPIDEYDRNRHFFFGHAFRDQYDQALSSLPIINSGFNIERIEVWVTNKQGNFDNSRNIVAFIDLGESLGNLTNQVWESDAQTNAIPQNSTNGLYNNIRNRPNIRNINLISSELSDFTNGIDYEKIESARLLKESEYKINTRLGYISLSSALQADEVLAVAYEYTFQGQTYKVGELSTDGISGDETLILKLLKGTNLTPKNKQAWDLMMKNIYSLNAYQVNKEDFRLDVVMRNDSTGTDINYFPEGEVAPGGINKEILLQVMNLDQLNSQSDMSPDGIFDYLEGITIQSQTGRIIFPVLEPFGSHLENKLNNSLLADKYVYDDLYIKSQTEASQNSEKNRFRLVGSYKSSGGGEISLNAMNVPRGSVVVTAGGIKLVENVDYTVDYSMGRVKIINQGYLNSGNPIQVSLESQSLYNLQTKTLMGSHFNYEFNDKLNVGATIMHLRERPLTQKVSFGSEPIANTIWGLNGTYNTESQALTNLIDKLPFVVATQPSSIAVEGEFAQLVPGHPDVIAKEGNAYIDDFEGSKTSYDMKYWTSWKLASVPQEQDSLVGAQSSYKGLASGFNRAKIAWYNIDPLFTRSTSQTPSHIKNDTAQLKNHFVREVFERELFPDKDLAYGAQTNIPIFNLAYYPSERGPYNYDPVNVNEDGSLKNPDQRWGGVMRKIDNSDFETANIEYIEFWMMDPFVYNNGADQGGDLYFNLGEVSEDILRDSRKSFEQGLPVPGENQNVDTTVWGSVPLTQSMVNAFNTSPEAQYSQDIGLDGLSSKKEKDFFETNFLGLVKNSLNSDAYARLELDPSSDDYHHYRGTVFDANATPVLERYKNFNNHEGNSVPSEYSPESYSTAAYTTPDVEDINQDNTLNETESYYQYKVSLRPNDMEVGKNYIINKITSDSKGGEVDWYHFKIPISSPDDKFGTIDDFRSIRFMRLFMHGFQNPAILRFASLDLVRSDWRKYSVKDGLNESNNYQSKENTNFEVSAVNIEEDGSRDPVNYELPPGVDRVTDPSNPQIQQLNEQSLSLKVSDLGYLDARGVYKNTEMDMRQYKRIKMYLHAEALKGESLENYDLKAFIRIGSDISQNYYEYEVPLKVTSHGTNLEPIEIWPKENNLDVALDAFTAVKLKRNDEKRVAGSNITLNDEYIDSDPDNINNIIKIKGNPTLSDVKVIVLGVRSNSTDDVSGEVWFNELRLTDFDEDGGWAANARVKINLSDLGTISLAGKTSTAGFGSIDQSVTERSQEDFYQYDIATNIEAGKLLGPKSRISVPLYYGYSKAVTTPKYYPLDPDIPMSVALDVAESSADKDSVKYYSQAVTDRQSINFTNVRLMPKEGKKPSVISPTNLSATYAYSETKKRDINTEYYTDKNYRGSLAYSYISRAKPVEPFKNTKIVSNKAFTLIRDFNFYYLPTQVSYRLEVVRLYTETQLRNISNPGFSIPVSVSKDFNMNRFFDLKFNLTKSLKLDFKSSTNARVDEPEGPVNKDLYADEYENWKDTVIQNILAMGRTTSYRHTTNLSYQVPINKLPFLDWTTLTARYNSSYAWLTGPVLDQGQSSPLGNTIQNTNGLQLSSTLNMKTLYSKWSYLKGLESKYNSRVRKNSNNTKRTERYNRDNVSIEAGKPIIVNHRLKTTDVKVRIFDENGRPINGKTEIINGNKLIFTADQSHEKARISITGTIEDINSPLQIAADYTALLFTGVKNVNIQYGTNNGTTLPGYMKGSNWSSSNFSQPGLPFVLGMQNRDFAFDAADKGWLSQDPLQTNPYMMTHSEDLTIKLTFEPIRGLKVDLTADRKYQRNLNEYYIYDGTDFTQENPKYRGNFNMSYNIIKTAFWSVDKEGLYKSKAYDNFLRYRSDIVRRLIDSRIGMYDGVDGGRYDGSYGYSLNSQEVLIPAFIAAYSGSDPDDIFLSSFPGFEHMQPNWRITYDGLSRIKWFKKVIKSFNITHNYRSTYSVGSYVSNYENIDELRDELIWRQDLQNNFIPGYQISSVTLSEQFSPLIQFNITWQNNINTRAEIKKTRTLNLSLTNSQLIENYTNEYVLGAGYRIEKLNLNIGDKGFSSDLDLRADFSIRENLAIIRKIEESVNQLTSGNKVVTLKLTADYALSDRFNMQLFYDRNMNKPYLSSSYPNSTANFGLSFRFSLAQ